MKRPLLHFAMLMALLAAGRTAVAGVTNSGPAKAGYGAYQIIERQNIFDASRDPGTNVPPAPPKQVDSLTLTGTLMVAGEQYAFFEGNQPRSRYATLAPAGVIEGFTVTEITTDGVKLESAGQPAINLRVGGGMARENKGPWELNSAPESAEQP